VAPDHCLLDSKGVWGGASGSTTPGSPQKAKIYIIIIIINTEPSNPQIANSHDWEQGGWDGGAGTGLFLKE
jgi:hypothetical protein